MTHDAGTRELAAVLIRRHFKGTVTIEGLFETLGGTTDPLIRAALDVVVHQPRRGFAGVSDRHWNRVYWPAVDHILAELEKGEAGVAPARPLYPPPTLWRLVGTFALFALIVAKAAESLLAVWRHARGDVVLPPWELALHLGFGALFVLLSIRTFLAFVARLSRYLVPPWWFE